MVEPKSQMRTVPSVEPLASREPGLLLLLFLEVVDEEFSSSFWLKAVLLFPAPAAACAKDAKAGNALLAVAVAKQVMAPSCSLRDACCHRAHMCGKGTHRHIHMHKYSCERKIYRKCRSL